MSRRDVITFVRRASPLVAAAAAGALLVWLTSTVLRMPTVPHEVLPADVKPVECGSSLQPMIDAAAPGATISLPACVARETLRLDKPVTLIGRSGTEIRGSDVWTAWQRNGATWISDQAVPALHAHGSCREGTSRCLWPEQVFVDGVPLEQVASGDPPAAGEFGLDQARHVVLGQDPAGHLVEVSVRTRWLVPTVDGVSIVGLRMRHAANDAQEGAITDDGHELNVVDSTLSDAHGAVISMTGPGRIIDNDIFRGGQLGVHKGGSIIEGNRIHDNNTEDFSWGWESGGVKSVLGGQVVVANEVYDNNGPGLWWDGYDGGVVIQGNRVHDNAAAGIQIEIGTDGEVADNVVWNNGAQDAEWGWGAGILVSSSSGIDVIDNAVAWNADGISVISQERDDAPPRIADVRVDRNVIIGTDGRPEASQNYGLAWLEDWSGQLFDATSGNGGTGNRFWYSTGEGDTRWAWAGDIDRLDAFAATPGGTDSRYLSAEEKSAILAAAGIPPAP